jgi:hypothetical protein
MIEECTNELEASEHRILFERKAWIFRENQNPLIIDNPSGIIIDGFNKNIETLVLFIGVWQRRG